MHVVETRGGIAATPEGLNSQIKFTCSEMLTALEHHVFEKVGETLLSRLLKGTACTAPKIDAGQACIGQRCKDATAAVGKCLMGQFRTVQGVGFDPISAFPKLLLPWLLVWGNG